MSNHKLNIDTGGGLADQAYEFGSMVVRMVKGRPSTASVRLRNAAKTTPWALDQDVNIKNNAGTTTYFDGTVAAPIIDQEVTPGSLRDVALSMEGADAILGAGGQGRRAGPRITARFTDTAAGDIITSLNTTFWGSTFTTSAVVSGPVIPELLFEGVSGFEALEMIEEAARGFVLAIDAAAAITFKHIDDLPASPFNITPGVRNYASGSLRVEHGAAAYYNKAVLYGPEQQGLEIKEIVQFPHTQELWGGKHHLSSFESDGDNKIVDTTNTVSYNAKKGGVISEAVGGYDFEWQSGDAAVRRLATLTAGTIDLAITHLPITPLIYAYADEEDIARRGGVPGGLYEAPPIVLSRLVPYTEAVSIVLGYLAKHAERQWRRVTFTTSTETSGVSVPTPGQTMTITVPEKSIDGTFIISEVVLAQQTTGDQWLISVTAYQGNVPRTSGARLKATVRAQRATPEHFTDARAADVMHVATTTEDIEAAVACTVADV